MKSIYNIFSFCFFLIITFVLVSCGTSNITQNYVDPNFSQLDLKDKIVRIIPVQAVFNNLIEEKTLVIVEEKNNTDFRRIDTDVQYLIGSKFQSYLDHFSTKYFEQKFIVENNNMTKVLFPVFLKNGRYQIKIDSTTALPEAFKEQTDFILIPTAVKLETIDNIDKHFKTEDLIVRGIKATLDYALYSVKMNKVMMSGSVSGVTAKSGLLQESFGRDDVKIAMDKAAESLVELFLN